VCYCENGFAYETCNDEEGNVYTLRSLPT
jgi:hypothetical protein